MFKLNCCTSLTRLASSLLWNKSVHLSHPQVTGHTCLWVSWSHINSICLSLLSAVCTWPAQDHLALTRFPKEGKVKSVSMPASLSGKWEMISNVNFDDYMIALGKSACCFPPEYVHSHHSKCTFVEKHGSGAIYHSTSFSTFPGISASLRKIAAKLTLKKTIERQEDQFVVKTTSTFWNYTVTFKVGQEFNEFTKGLDNRHLKVNGNG